MILFKKQNGFTFLEFIISLSLFSIIFIFITLLFRYETKIISSTDLENTIQINSHVAMNRIIEAIKKEPNLKFKNNAIISEYDDVIIYIIDIHPNKKRGLINYTKDDNGKIINNKNEIIAEYIEDFNIINLGHNLIQIKIVSKNPKNNRLYYLERNIYLDKL